MTYWDERYRSTVPEERSWTEADPLESLALIDALGLEPSDALIDVGGGASQLVDALLARGFVDLTVLDLAASALDEARARLEDPTLASRVEWIVADVTSWSPVRTYRLWHDRAVFHFLTDAAAREDYVRVLLKATAVGSAVVLATFAPDGPETCSGLPVARHDAEGLATAIGPAFELTRAERVMHTTPWGSTQPFTWAVLERRTQRART